MKRIDGAENCFEFKFVFCCTSKRLHTCFSLTLIYINLIYYLLQYSFWKNLGSLSFESLVFKLV